MMIGEVNTSEFFVAGGTLRTNAESYVSRPADHELLTATMAGEFCYVLTPRQMGKSSLMVRTARELQTVGVRTVILDLTSIGTDVTVEQWYLGLLSRINSRINRLFDLETWWGQRSNLSVVQRFTDYLREMLLQLDQRVVIFIDEIDTTLSLEFRDDFFAAIRYFYNMRSDEPGLEKLSIALLGVATPADLIRDRSRTPFNIGRRIELNEFSRADAQVLESGLESMYPGSGNAVFERIFYWTNGHPYLTQKLCLAASEDRTCTESDARIDEIVHQLFLSDAARRETNLQFIRDNIMGQPPKDQQRLLSLYRDVLRNKLVVEDERSTEQNRLKLIGLVKGNERVLHVRNNVYRTVFNERWIKETIPIDWNRRIAIASVVVVLLMATGVAFFVWNSRQQTAERLIEEQEVLFQSGNPSVQLTSLEALYNFGQAETIAKANELYDSLNQADRLALFDPVATAGLDSSLGTVALAAINREWDSRENVAVLEAISAALIASSSGENLLAGNGLNQWLAGRSLAEAGDFRGAINEYRDAESLLDLYPFPGLFYDLGVAHAETGDVDSSLTYLERAANENEYQAPITLSTLPVWRTRVGEFVPSRPELLARWSTAPDEFPALAVLLPTPTITPTPTATLPATAIPIASDTPRATATPITPSPQIPTLMATATPEGPITLVVQRNANLRSGPGLDYDLIVAVPRDTVLDIIGRTLTGDWYNVIYLGRTSWISSGFVLVEGDNNNISVVATLPPRPTATRTPTAQPTTTQDATTPPDSGSGNGSGSSSTLPTSTPFTLPTNTPFSIPTP